MLLFELKETLETTEAEAYLKTFFVNYPSCFEDFLPKLARDELFWF